VGWLDRHGKKISNQPLSIAEILVKKHHIVMVLPAKNGGTI